MLHPSPVKMDSTTEEARQVDAEENSGKRKLDDNYKDDAQQVFQKPRIEGSSCLEETEAASAEDVKKMNVDELCQWLKPKVTEKRWKIVEEVIREQDIMGSNFLDITKADWKADGLPTGVAVSLGQIAQGVLGGGGASANDFVDVSFQLYKDLTTPFNSEPALNLK